MGEGGRVWSVRFEEATCFWKAKLRRATTDYGRWLEDGCLILELRSDDLQQKKIEDNSLSNYEIFVRIPRVRQSFVGWPVYTTERKDNLVLE